MKNATTLFLAAVVGLFGTGRMASSAGANRAGEGLPAMDLEVSAKTQTATFALG
jgi:hypothetical protein